MSSRDVVPETASAPRTSVSFGIVVGVDHYPHFRSLRGAIADAERFYTWMCTPAGGGVEPRHARLILSTPEPAMPIHSQIDTTLGDLVALADECGGAGRLYFYFSGHGASCFGNGTDDVALLLATWSRNYARLALSSRAYKGELTTIGLFKELVVFLDCCRGTTQRVVGLPPTMTPSLKSTPLATREFVAYATETGRSAFETNEIEWQGVFTRQLISILQRSPHGITAGDLKIGLERDLGPLGQQAHVVNELLPDSLFGRRGVLPQLAVHFKHAEGRVRLRDGLLRVIAEHLIVDRTWQLELPAGLYKLESDTQESLIVQHGGADTTHVVF